MSKLEVSYIEVEGRMVISIENADTLDRLTVIQMVSQKSGSSEMYYAGLEKNHKKLVAMSSVTFALTNVIEAYIAIEELNENTWHQIMQLFKPFIHSKLKWDVVQAFLQTSKQNNNWE